MGTSRTPGWCSPSGWNWTASPGPGENRSAARHCRTWEGVWRRHIGKCGWGHRCDPLQWRPEPSSKTGGLIGSTCWGHSFFLFIDGDENLINLNTPKHWRAPYKHRLLLLPRLTTRCFHLWPKYSLLGDLTFLHKVNLTAHSNFSQMLHFMVQTLLDLQGGL